MQFNGIHSVYFLGIGGIGMSALARYFNARGFKVAGYDKTPTPLTDELISEGIAIHFEDNLTLVPSSMLEGLAEGKTLLIYTPAIPANHKEFQYFKSKGYTLLKRSEVLGMLTREGDTIAIAGTHGKTTTSTLVAHLLQHARVDCTAFLGGISQNIGSNLLLSDAFGKAQEQHSLLVVEADEYDRSFLHLHPRYAVITSVDADHLDIYQDPKWMLESYQQFANQVTPGGVLLLKAGIVNQLQKPQGVATQTYALQDATADYSAQQIRVADGYYYFDLHTPHGVVRDCKLGLPGLHNVENAVAASAMAIQAGVSLAQLQEGLATFKGVKRRFDVHVRNERVVYIDDYAHHPEELRACISSVKELYAGKKILGLFQPHLYTRTRDFVEGFAHSLELLDDCVLLEIYPARELPIEGISSSWLMSKMKHDSTRVLSKSDALQYVKNSNAQVVLTLGAGDIDQLVEPITKLLQHEK